MSTTSRLPALRIGALCLIASILNSCWAVETLDVTNMPDDGSLDLMFECSNKQVAVSDSCNVHGVVRLSTADLAGSGWTVDILTSAGTFVIPGATSAMTAVRLTTNAAGEVVVLYKAPADTGRVIFAISSHGTIKKDTIAVINPDQNAGDSPAVVLIKLAPADIAVKVGDSTLVDASFLDAAGKSLTGRLAYFSTGHSATASVKPGPADKAWVVGVDTGTATLRAARRAILATAKVIVTR